MLSVQKVKFRNHIVQGDPKQTVIFEMNTTLLWVNLGKRSNGILQWGKDNI